MDLFATRSVEVPSGPVSVMVPAPLSSGLAFHCEPADNVPWELKESVDAMVPASCKPEDVKTVTWLLLPWTTRMSISFESWSMSASR